MFSENSRGGYFALVARVVTPQAEDALAPAHPQVPDQGRPQGERYFAASVVFYVGWQTGNPPPCGHRLLQCSKLQLSTFIYVDLVAETRARGLFKGLGIRGYCFCSAATELVTLDGRRAHRLQK